MQVEQISAVTLVVADMARAVSFYSALQLEVVHGGPHEAFTSYRVGDGYLNLQQGEPGDTTRWGRVILYVDDVDAVWQHLVDEGVQPEAEPRDAPWQERYFHVRDPDGHELSFARPVEVPVLRPAAAADVPLLHALNEAEVPDVGALDAEAFTALLDLAAATTVVWLGGRIAGFVVLFDEGSSYASPNYRWFAARHDAFAYVDRVVIAPWARRRGLGARLYAAAIAHAGDRPLAAEVNTVPSNEDSLAFHARQGFIEVDRVSRGADKEVAMLLRPA